MPNSSTNLIRKPLLLKIWDQHPKILSTIINLGIFLKYKTINTRKIPDKIKLISNHVIYIDPSENRGKALLLKSGVTQNRLTDFWKDSVELLEPSIVLDIGVNYGECLFSTSYNANTTIIGVEANQRLLPYIKKSLREHPNQQQMKLIHGFASDKDVETQNFYVNTNWSGTSSGIQMNDLPTMEVQQVKSFQIDTILSQYNLEKETVLFKVDVEGYEAFVLKGMKETFSQSKDAVGFIEFDSEYVKKSGIILFEFFTYLHNHFYLFAYETDQKVIEIQRGNIEEWVAQCEKERIHTDIILLKNKDLIQNFSFTSTDKSNDSIC